MGDTIFNETGVDRDLRIESLTNEAIFNVDAGNDRINIGTDTPDTSAFDSIYGVLNVDIDAYAQKVTDGTGATGAKGVLLNSQDGQDISAATDANGGDGGPNEITSGKGGDSAGAGAFSGIAGAGGSLNFLSGAGGVSTTTGVGTNAGGVGGQCQFVSGIGGACSGASSGLNTGGSGGLFSLKAGQGGAATNGTTNTGGNGGDVDLYAGKFGTGATADGTPGSIHLYTYNASNALQTVIIKSGEVGIGTATPDETLQVVGSAKIGDDNTNYMSVDTAGDVSFTGTSRLAWTKTTANNITQGNGTHTGTVSNLQTAHDGSFYHIDEAAVDPGFELTIEFVSVTGFNWVQILGTYDGSATHSVQIALYNFNTTTWDCFGAFPNSQAEVATAGEYTLGNESFFVPDDDNYIGTGGDSGDVRVRIRHTMTGNAAHDIDLDVVALYQ
jgi:hypothetical protein